MQEECSRWQVSWLWPLAAGLKALGSLQLAVALIAVCIAVLVWGTSIEGRHGEAAAHSGVYDTAWFAAINLLLAVNVLCALVIRFPWRRRQAGFVLTHVGILVLLAGCLATRFWGVEAQLSVYEGHAGHVADEDSHQLDLGFQVYLHQFRRKLDPGSAMASHYSSRVDFLDLGNPPKKLRENVLITLNAPVNFTDPLTGRTYRLFQSSFDGPWLPGDPEFDRLVGNDHSRDQVYLSRLSVNYDPGRGLKYAGCLMIVVGIGVVYYWRRIGGKGSGFNVPGVCKRPPTAVGGGAAVIGCLGFLAILLCFAGVSRGEDQTELDWSAWRRLPAFSQGRIMPLDSFALETIEAICGRAEPTLSLPGGRPREFYAAELLFSWLVEPEKWENVPFLVAQDEELRRDVLRLPLKDADGRRLRYASPVEVENSVELGRRWEEIKRQEEAAGKPLSLTGVDKSVKNLVEAYVKYRQLTFDPRAPKASLRRFYGRALSAADAWRKLAGDLQAAQRISREQEIRQEMVASGDALQKIIAATRGREFSPAKVEPAAAAFRRAGEQLAARLADSDDKPLAALAANLGRQTAEMHLALYDNGDSLRLAPALDAGALEENRTPGDDASPWLGFQAMILGSDDLLRAYPQPELRAVRKAFAEVKAAYLSHGGADIPVCPGQTGMSAPLAAAMDRFVESLRALAENIDPLRARLPIQHRDQELIATTAYPPPGSTDVEVFYNRLDPFFWSWVVSLAATLCLLLAVGRWQRPLFWLGVAVLLAAQAFTAAGMRLRGYITGLVPLTGMFETVIFVALYAALVGLWFTLKPLATLPNAPALQCGGTRIDHVLHRRLFALAGAIVSLIAAALAYYAPSTVMHRHIGAAMPILRDNFWLAVHVVTIMASYATGAIALVLGNIALGYYLFGRYSIPHTPCADLGTRRVPDTMDLGTWSVPTTVLAGFIYTAIQITVLLLAAGTVLGALWADKAWGRFWAWDPKEVWALVSLLVYLLLLHARHIGWSGDFGMAAAAVFGFTAILITWYGVNFLLGSGMHAYGSGAGGKWAVLVAIAIEWLFLAAAAVRKAIESHATIAGS